MFKRESQLLSTFLKFLMLMKFILIETQYMNTTNDTSVVKKTEIILLKRLGYNTLQAVLSSPDPE